MSNVYLGYRNLLLAVPEASSGVTNPTVLASNIVGRAAILAASAYVDFYIQPSNPISLVGVAGLKVIPGAIATVVFEFGTGIGTNDLGSKSLSISVTGNYKTYAELLATELDVAEAYCRVSFTNCSEVGLCWASGMLNPEVGITLGFTRAYEDFSQVTKSSLTGARTVIAGPQARTYSMKFDFVDADTEFALFDDFIQATGTSKQVMIIPGLNANRRNRDIMVGYLGNNSSTSFVQPYLQDWAMDFEEAL